MSTSVIVFAKAPVAGLAKTRLAPALGSAGAAGLAERMLRHALTQAAAADVGPVELCAALDTTHPVLRDAATACGASLAEQGPGDLGLRMHRAFARHLLRHGRALLIGTDAPALDAALLRQAAKALQQHEVVFVPALDAGYAGVTVQFGSSWCGPIDLGSDVVLWATGAEAHGWQRDPTRRGALAVDSSGFIRIDAQLRSVSHPQVFAAGDCACWSGQGLPKAGVHAVRMGPMLADNLRAALTGRGDFELHRPQRQFLALLATGDGRAIASRGPFGVEGAWTWRWKDRIDRRFLNQFRPLGSPPRAAAFITLPADGPTVPIGDRQ